MCSFLSLSRLDMLSRFMRFEISQVWLPVFLQQTNRSPVALPSLHPALCGRIAALRLGSHALRHWLPGAVDWRVGLRDGFGKNAAANMGCCFLMPFLYSHLLLPECA